MTGFELMRSDESIFRNSYQMKNLSQLKHAGDSIRNELNLKSEQFYSTLLRNNIFKLNKKLAVTYIPERYTNTPTFWQSAESGAGVRGKEKHRFRSHEKKKLPCKQEKRKYRLQHQ